MKTIILTFILYASSFSYGQAGFVWDVTDTTSQDPTVVHNINRVFVAKTWLSGKSKIEMESVEKNMMIINNYQTVTVRFMLGDYSYTYQYQITLMAKKGKYRILVDNFVCVEAMFNNKSNVTPIPVFEGDVCPVETGTFRYPGITANRAVEIMPQLKAKVQLMVDYYLLYMKENLYKSDW